MDRHFSITYQDAQRAYGALTQRWNDQSPDALPPQEQSLPIACELILAALSMKPHYQEPGLIVARRYCTRVGLEPQHVEEFVAAQVHQHKAEAGEQ